MESYDYGTSWENDNNPQMIDNMGNPSVYYQTHKNDYLGNTTTPFQTTLLYWKHLTNPNQTDIYRATIKPKYLTSSTLSATDGGSTRKIVYANNRWNRLFMSHKQLSYSYSTDDGVNWIGYETISDTFDLADISNPSLTAYGDTLHAIFTAEERKIYYVRKVGSQNWQAPKLIYTAPQTIFGIASAVDALRKGHVTWIEDNGMLLSTQVMKHGTFAVHSVYPAISGISTVQNGYGMINPGMDYDLNGTPHVVLQQDGEIYYKYKTGTYTWSSVVNLSNSASDPSTHPAIELIYNSPHVVWQENADDNNEIYYRYKGSVWSAAANVSESAGDSKHPTIISTINGPIIIWGEVCSVKYYLPDMDETGVIDSYEYLYANYPSVGLISLSNGGNRLVVQWTDQFIDHVDQAPYRIGHKPFEMDINPFFAKPSSSLTGIPDRYLLFPNYPNPFNPNTQITFGIPTDSRVGITVYDKLGREIKFLTDHEYKAGYHSVQWNGLDNKGNRVSSGVYIYRMITKDKSICKKMLLVK